MITTNPYEILDNAVSLAKTNTTGEIELKLIGRPSAFSSTIDRKRSATKYLQSKMNIVDLIPCDFAINVSSFFDSNQNFSTSNIDLTSLIQHTVTYDVPCDRYKTQQEYY